MNLKARTQFLADCVNFMRALEEANSKGVLDDLKPELDDGEDLDVLWETTRELIELIEPKADSYSGIIVGEMPPDIQAHIDAAMREHGLIPPLEEAPKGIVTGEMPENVQRALEETFKKHGMLPPDTSDVWRPDYRVEIRGQTPRI